MWYHMVATVHLLHFGKACWVDIKWQRHATGGLLPNTIVEPLLQTERTWVPDKHLAKSSVDSMMGL